MRPAWATLLSILASLILVLGLYIMVKRYQEVLLRDTLSDRAQAQSTLLIANRTAQGHGADFNSQQDDSELTWFLTSPYPFPDSQNDARKTPLAPEMLSGFLETPAGEIFRYSEDLIVREGCVTCHNSLTASPRRDWRVGDVMGQQVLSLPVIDAPQAGSSAFRDIIIFLSIFFTVAIIVALTSQALVQRALTIVERREAESRLLSLVASRTDNAVIIASPEGKTEWVNDGFTRMTGFTLEDVSDVSIDALILGTLASPEAQERVLRALSEHEPFSEITPTQTKDGRPYWMAVDCQPIFDETGTLTTIIAIQRDISELKDREQALETARQAAEAANEAKSQFLANMSHEIRTPMNGIIGMTGLLLTTALGKRQHGYANTIRVSGEALLDIINDILDFSKIDAGRLVFVETVFELRPVMQGTMDILEPSAQTKDVRLSMTIDDRLDAFVSGDKGRLRQVLLNLVGNAVKFTPSGSIQLSARPAGSGGSMVRFEVSDTGIGIPAEDLSSIFESFSQIDASSSRRFEGTGLGLAISRQLVEGMGGELGVESTLGEGSTFWFELSLPADAPLTPREPADAIDVSPVEGTDRVDEPDRVEPLPPLRILVAEDNTINQQVAEGFLTRLGHSVDIADTGAEAVAAVQAQAYDLVFMDVQMPQMDGLEATEAIRALPEPQRSVPIIAMTANALQGDAELCLERGMNDYLSKPVLMDALQRAILRNRRHTEATAKGDSNDAPPPTLDPKAEIDHAALDTLSTQLGADMVDEILTIFSEDTDHRLAGIATAAQDKTSGIIAKQAHSIKGSAASLGLQRLVRAAAALETAALAGEWPTIVNCCASLVAAKHGFDAWLKDRI